MIQELNDAQREAVEHDGGPLLVLAGAGSGKTRVLTARVAHLIEHRNVSPGRIMAVTFTNRAASEMRRRVTNILGCEPAGLWMGTFHSVSARLLRREAHRIGFTPQFTIYDEDDRLSLIRRLLKDGGYSPKAYRPAAIQYVVSQAKNRLVSPSELREQAEDDVQRVAAEIYDVMGRVLREANAMDFDDLLLHPLTLFRDYPDRLTRYQAHFQSVLVDEFQDTNRAQYLLVKQIAEKNRDICVVGDDDQSIYGWRGAEVRNMYDFQRDFSDAQLVRLEENYRSTSVILDTANEVISENMNRLGKTLFTSRVGGDLVVVTATADEGDEAEWVLSEIVENVTKRFCEYKDFSILYRTNAQSRPFEDVFRRNVIPYQVVGSVSFYARREIRDLVAYLRLVVNPADDQAFIRAVQSPRRGVGKTSLAFVGRMSVAWNRSFFSTASVADRMPELQPRARSVLLEFVRMIERLREESREASAATLLESIIEVTDYENYLAEEGLDGADRIENVRALLDGAAEWSEEEDPEDPSSPTERYLTAAALTTSADHAEGDPEGVTLMTAHMAKGLEWPVVFMTGMEDGLFPLSRSMETQEGGEEERRLAYVGITRAQDRLYLSWARARRRSGQLMPGMPSRFLDALPPGLVEARRTSSVFGDFAKAAASVPVGWDALSTVNDENESQDSPRYVRGERVRHRKFGSGQIVDVSGKGRHLKVVVSFDKDEVGPRTLLAAYAGLERDWESV